MNNVKGKLIVIDGTDGSGKATQLKLLLDRLQKAGLDVEIADFPQYGNKSAGLAEEYLSGKYGSAENVNPYVSSIFFSVDRFDASFKIKQWLNQGKIVISNRYTTSNMAHQGCKISNPLERKAFFDWIKNLEEKIFNIPKPDAILFLHVDAGTAQNLTRQRNKVDWSGKVKDIHEENIRHLEMAEKTYIEISQNYNNITLFPCMENGRLLSKELINDKLWNEVQNIINAKKSPQTILENTGADYKKTQGAELQADYSLKVMKLSGKARVPDWSRQGNCLNIYSYDYHSLMPYATVEFKTGIAINMPRGYSGILMNYDQPEMKEISVLPFIVSPNSNREIIIKIMNTSEDIVNISPGIIIAKIIIHKTEKPLIVRDDLAILENDTK